MSSADAVSSLPAPLRLDNVARRYRTEAGVLPVLEAADLTLQAGEIVALVAPSGTGKSTLLHLAGLLERPDAGEVHIVAVDQLNTYDVIAADDVVFTRGAYDAFVGKASGAAPAEKPAAAIAVLALAMLCQACGSAWWSWARSCPWPWP